MLEVLKQYGSVIATTMSVGSLVFLSGRESNRIDEVIRKAHSAESERKDIRDVVFDMHGRICSIEQDIKYIRSKEVK